MSFELWIMDNSKFIIQNSFVVIRLPIQDSHCPIELLNKDKADHLMREGHLAEGDLLGCRPIDRLAKPIRASHHKQQPLGHGVHLLLDISGKLHGGKLLAMLVEQDQVIPRLQSLQDQLSLPLLLLCLREVLGVLNIRYHLQLERDVVGQSSTILLDSLRKIAGIRLTNHNQSYFHRFSFAFERAKIQEKYIPSRIII